MPDDMLPSTSLEDRLEQVLADLLLAEERGERPDLSHVLRRFPELETPLLEFFRNRASFDRLAPWSASASRRTPRRLRSRWRLTWQRYRSGFIGGNWRRPRRHGPGCRPRRDRARALFPTPRADSGTPERARSGTPPAQPNPYMASSVNRRTPNRGRKL